MHGQMHREISRAITAFRQQPILSQKTPVNQQAPSLTILTIQTVRYSHKINTSTGKSNLSLLSSPVQTKQVPTSHEKKTALVVLAQTRSRQTTLETHRHQQNNQKSINGLEAYQVPTSISDQIS